MNGIELSKKYFFEYGMPVLEEQFGELLPYLSAGFTGSGSEHYGYDDEISRDHDFEPGFCLFLPDEGIVSRRQAFLLERAYAGLPDEFEGFHRLRLSPVGGNRHGVMRTSEFFEAAAGSADGELSTEAWLHIPDYALAEAVNGEIFFDNYGEVTAIREKLRNMPKDVKLKRIAGNLLIMAQSGQYNFNRCLGHGEPEAAQLACFEFAEAAMKAVFLLDNSYMPYYKWSFRALRANAGETELADDLYFLLHGDNRDCGICGRKTMLIEKTACLVTGKLYANGLAESKTPELEAQAYAVNQKITDLQLRSMNILAAV